MLGHDFGCHTIGWFGLYWKQYEVIQRFLILIHHWNHLEALKKTDAQARHPKTVIGQHRPGHQHLLKVPQIILL